LQIKEKGVVLLKIQVLCEEYKKAD